MLKLFPKKWSEIARKGCTKLSRREEPTVPDIRNFTAKIHKTGFIVDKPRYDRTDNRFFCTQCPWYDVSNV